jgi:transposase
MLKNIDFTALAKRETNARKKLRLLALAHFKDGVNKAAIARMLKVSRGSVNKWVALFLQNGLAGLETKPSPGRPPKLTAVECDKVAAFIAENSRSSKGGRLIATDIQRYIEDNFGVQYQQSNIYRLLHELGFSWITSRSKHPKQSEEVQEDFKKFQIETINLIPSHIALDKVDIWFQDEARFGQQNTTTRLWAEKGSRPRAVKQQQFEYAYLFGAVCPGTGETEALLAPLVNKEVMIQHLEQISITTKPGRHAVVIMDGAGWHTQDIAKDINNVSIIKLPAYSPELNPIEQVWSWLRQHHLANRCFNGYEDILNACTSAWNHFRQDSQRVIKLCSRDWAMVVK